MPPLKPLATPVQTAPTVVPGLTLTRTASELRAAVLAARVAGKTVGLVPTMGALHQGHAALVRAAAADHGAVIVTIFVNPKQFNDASDLEAYPRTEQADAELAAEAGATILFAPDCDEVYPEGFSTSVRVSGISDALEGAHRPGHFDGVTTVVTRLLGFAQADQAYFGQKDAQQLAVVRTLVRDLAIATEIVSVPTVREAGGLAMSSRNTRLSRAERKRALAINRGLRAAEALAAAGASDAAVLTNAVRAPIAAAGLDVDYVELVDRASFP